MLRKTSRYKPAAQRAEPIVQRCTWCSSMRAESSEEKSTRPRAVSQIGGHHGKRTKALGRAISRYVKRHLFRGEENPRHATQDGEGSTIAGFAKGIRKAPRRD